MPEFHDHVEAEWQFDVDDLSAVEDWVRELPVSMPIAITASDPDEHVDTYYDTEDWRVFRAGYALRLRQSLGQAELTLKSLDRNRNGFAQRREANQRLLDTDIDGIDDLGGPVGERVTAMRGTRRTCPLFTVITMRNRYRLWRDGCAIGELALDHVTYFGESFEDQTQLSRIEVEAPAGQLEMVRPFVDELASACALRPAASSKFRTGLHLLGLIPNGLVDVGRTDFDRTSTIVDLARAVLRRHFVELLRHEPGTRLGDDPEELHDMRVAARRLRAALALFKRDLPGPLVLVSEDLRWVAGALGEVRDLDVQLAEITAWRDTLEQPDGDALVALVSELHQRRAAARSRMLDALNSEHYEQFVAEFSEQLRSGSRGLDSPLAVAIVPDLVLRRLRKFRKLADRLDRSSPDSDLHRLRIEGKRLRYALEFVSPLYGKAAEPFVQRLIDVQDTLGRHHDSIVAIDHLRAIACDPDVILGPSTIFAMGRVAERYAAAAAESRARFPKVYKRLGDKRLKPLEREMRRRASDARKEGGAEAAALISDA